MRLSGLERGLEHGMRNMQTPHLLPSAGPWQACMKESLMHIQVRASPIVASTAINDDNRERTNGVHATREAD